MDIQTLINAANPGDTVKIVPGVYTVDAINAPIKLKSDITLDLTGVGLEVIPNNVIFSIPVQVTGCNNVTIQGGTIKGDRDTHTGPTDASVGGGGGLIAIGEGASNIKVNGTTLTRGFCDGILVLDATQVEINSCICDGNRRQGMSAANVNGLHVTNSQFINSGGTPPGDGIDCENDLATQTIANVLIENCTFSGNQGSGVGFGSPGTYTNIVVRNNSFDHKTQPIWVGGNAGSLGTPWWAAALHLMLSWAPFYRWWGYPTSWSR